MITEKDTIRCEAVFNDDKTHRLVWKQVWNKDKPMACVIMLNPSMSDTIICDLTTSLVVNNVARLESYGGVFIVNLFTILTPKLQMRFAQDTDINDYENDNYILKCCEQSSEIILAWGCGAEKNVRISNRIDQVLTLLSKHEEKFRVISDGRKSGIHPFFMSPRFGTSTVVELRYRKEKELKYELQNWFYHRTRKKRTNTSGYSKTARNQVCRQKVSS